MNKTLNKKQQQSLETRKKLEKGIQLAVQELGVNHLKVKDVCRYAEVSVGAFYKCYKSKEDMLIAYFSSIDEYYAGVKQKILNSNNIIENLEVFIIEYATYCQLNPIERSKSIIKSRLYGGNYSYYSGQGREMFLILSTIIEKGQKQDLFIETKSVYELSEFIIIILRGFSYDHCIYDGKYNLKDRITKEIPFILKAILK